MGTLRGDRGGHDGRASSGDVDSPESYPRSLGGVATEGNNTLAMEKGVGDAVRGCTRKHTHIYE